MGTESKRLRILNELKSTFLQAAESEKSIDKNKLISQICMNYGMTKKTAFSYIQLLLDADFIIEDEFGLWLKQSKSETGSSEQTQ